MPVERDSLPSLKIQDKIRDLSVYQRQILDTKFPKKFRYRGIKARIEDATEEIRYLVCKVKKFSYKKGMLEELDCKVELLRDYIREAIDDKDVSIGFKSSKYWRDLVNEIGAMVGSWLKKEKEQAKYKNSTKEDKVNGMSTFIDKEDISDKEDPLYQ